MRRCASDRSLVFPNIFLREFESLFLADRFHGCAIGRNVVTGSLSRCRQGMGLLVADCSRVAGFVGFVESDPLWWLFNFGGDDFEKLGRNSSRRREPGEGLHYH